MPRLSLYHPNRTNDYKFIDRRASEMFTIGGADLYVHKYLGPANKEESNDATQPAFDETDPSFIEDVLLLENRDREYDPDIYIMRGVYNIQDIDFDLSQFGLFLNNDTLFITFHYNNMIDTLGRKLMAGDVLEAPNLKDYHPLDESNAKALPRYYVIQDAAFAAEGFSPTWQPHLWRIKAVPMTGSQEYNDILKEPFEKDNQWDPQNFYPEGSVVVDGDTYYQASQDVPSGTEIDDSAYWEEYTPDSLKDNIATLSKDLEFNQQILQQAEAEVPLSGYDTTKFYIVATDDHGRPASQEDLQTDDSTIVVEGTTPKSNGYTMGYLTGDGVPPNGLPVTPGVSFPINPNEGDYALRLDYFPNRLFRYNGSRWIKVEDNIRTDLTPGDSNKSLYSGFVNNTDTVSTTDRGDIPSRQSLSDILKPKADN
jgi:hypothetical protein